MGDLRLTEPGGRLGLGTGAPGLAFGERREVCACETARLKASWVQPAKIPLQNQIDVLGQPIEREHSLFDLLRRPNVGYAALKPWMSPEAGEPGTAIAAQVEIAAKYAGYIERQKEEVEHQLAQELVELPRDIDYS